MSRLIGSWLVVTGLLLVTGGVMLVSGFKARLPRRWRWGLSLLGAGVVLGALYWFLFGFAFFSGL
ncbi:MAG: hypothetical protein LKJ69_12665 [Lactobacillus sp.]|jgi:hypothetical protein|nr:hypothetical protein [Lactobacillus sp.]MCI2034218.1 hypothetical protein [Lactobacillus sp.]